MPKQGNNPMPAPGAVMPKGAGSPQPMAGLFGPMTQDRYDAVMSMLAASMAGANQSGNPLAAFVAPLLGSVVGMGAKNRLDAAQANAASEGALALLGRALSPAEEQAVRIASDPNAPDYLQSIAKNMLPKAPATMGGGGATPRRAASGGSSARPAKLTYIARDPDGVIRGYNAATGKREPVQNADAPASPANGQPVVPAPPPDPVLPRDPGSVPGGSGDLSALSDEELLSRYR